MKIGIEALSIHVTKRCNLRCPHCYQKDYPAMDINLEYVHKAVALLRPSWLIFYGGEPMTKPELIEEIMDAYPRKKFLIYTNGTIMNKKIFDRMQRIVVTLESFFLTEAEKYRPITKAQHETTLRVITQYFPKTRILHNIYPMRHDPYFYRTAKLRAAAVESYPIVLPSEEMRFEISSLESGLWRERQPLTLPKLRVLENGMITRDMRGVHNLCHIDEWDDRYLARKLPIHERCLRCAYFRRCPACNIFPHFCHDILNKFERPHFCKYTEALWKNRSFLK